MSASNEWTEWHLTPAGWVEGDSKTDFSKSLKPVPVDRVQTVEHRQYLSSSFSRLEITNDILWSCEDEEVIAELREKFGASPNHL